MEYVFHFEAVLNKDVLSFLLKGAVNTIYLSFVTIITSIIVGVIVGIFRTFKNNSIENNDLKGRAIYYFQQLCYWLATIYVEIVRGTPLLVQIFVVYFGFPSIGLDIPSWPAALLALTINNGAYMADIVRSGIESVDNGQVEASRSLGLSYFKTMQYIVLPQAIKRIIPPLTSQFAALIKDTSLVSIIAISELTFSGQQVIARTFRSFEVWVTVAFMYFAMTFTVSLISKYFERKEG